MPRGTCTIFNWNGTHDLKSEYGISLSDGALSVLLTPPALKERISNESRLEDGKRVDIWSDTHYASRELTLEMHLIASTFADFVTKLRAFIAAVNNVPEGVILSYTIYGQQLQFRLQYLSCTQFAAYNGTLGKFAVRFIERYPTLGLGTAPTLTLTSSNPNEEETE
ncbi:MAG: hypothetical protein IKW85_02090 [Muribaculaceae bacterium]|nr:hypothetical protein [Muribaculaceae bacterium]